MIAGNIWNHMKNNQYYENILESEKMLSKAYGAKVVKLSHGDVLHNPLISWGGDFNRGFLTSGRNFTKAVQEVKEYFENNLLELTRIDYFGELADLSQESLNKENLALQPYFYLGKKLSKSEYKPELDFYHPSLEEHLANEIVNAKSYGFFSKEWEEKSLPLTEKFYTIFKPIWFYKENKKVASVNYTTVNEVIRLFAVEVTDKYQGQGFGRQILYCLSARFQQKYEMIVVQSSEKNIEFYEKCKFEKLFKSAVLWLK